ncbi:MAG: peptidoglycan DD-metalloendopeptidase family protein, partial [Nitriliruptorales bacterium]|nr:peptidoglycan DD-metalloendopeptidase family protein [Nitriliruptorales bacterium]
QLKLEQEALERVAAQKREITADAKEIRDDRALKLAATSQRIRALQGQESHLTSESRELAALARRAERAAAAASRAQAAAAAPAAPTSAGGWTWPARGPLTSGFGYRWGRMHEGIDIGAASGAPIYAASGGTVSYAGSMSGYGNLVLVDHGGGTVTAYAHQSAILVGVGARVGAGQQIGRVGSTGQSTGPHLHFEVRVGGSPRDPMAYLP